MKNILLGLTTSLALVSITNLPALADIFKGGKYTVTISGASYRGCDSKNRCVYIPMYSYRERGSYIWEKNGYTYNMSPAGSRDGNYRLKVFSPSHRLILNQLVKPVNSRVD